MGWCIGRLHAMHYVEFRWGWVVELNSLYVYGPVDFHHKFDSRSAFWLRQLALREDKLAY